MGRLKWSHCWSQMVSFWVAVRKLLPLGAKLVSFWMVGNHRVSNRLTWSQLVLFWVAYRKAPPQRTKMASFWVVWFPCGYSGLSWSQLVSFWVALLKLRPHNALEFTFWGSFPKQGETALFVNAICLLSNVSFNKFDLVSYVWTHICWRRKCNGHMSVTELFAQ